MNATSEVVIKTHSSGGSDSTITVSPTDSILWAFYGHLFRSGGAVVEHTAWIQDGEGSNLIPITLTNSPDFIKVLEAPTGIAIPGQLRVFIPNAHSSGSPQTRITVVYSESRSNRGERPLAKVETVQFAPETGESDTVLVVPFDTNFLGLAGGLSTSISPNVTLTEITDRGSEQAGFADKNLWSAGHRFSLAYLSFFDTVGVYARGGINLKTSELVGSLGSTLDMAIFHADLP